MEENTVNATNGRTTKELAYGRWENILLTLGVEPRLLDKRKHWPCPGCGGKDRFRFTNISNRGDYFCNQCGSGDGFTLLGMVHGWSFKQAAVEVERVIGNGNIPQGEPKQVKEDVSGKCRKLYRLSRPIESDDPAGLYLRKRGLPVIGQHLKHLRYVPDMYYSGSDGDPGGHHPGMIAVFSDVSGKWATIHRTYLTRGGGKAKVKSVRKFMPGGIHFGSAIRLSSESEDIGHIGVAEGIETALSARQLYKLPVWATGNATLLEQWQPPPEAKRITIFADNDKNFTGQIAAYTLARRLVMTAEREGIEREVDVGIPPDPGTDFNDILQQQQGGK